MKKGLTWTGMAIGSIVGGYIPVLFGDASFFSLSSVILTALGGFLGIWIGYKLDNQSF